MRHLRRAPGRHVTFGLDGADYRCRPSTVGGSSGRRGPIAEVAVDAPAPAARRHQRPRRVGAGASRPAWPTPTAVADGAGRRSAGRRTASSSSARPTACAGTTTPRPRPRTPRSAAIRAFDHVVLIAGGRNKGLDLTPMAAEPERIRAVVAIGEAADDIAAVFARRWPGASSRARRWPRPSTPPAKLPVPGDVVCCRRAAPASTGTGFGAAATTSAASSSTLQSDWCHAWPR